MLPYVGIMNWSGKADLMADYSGIHLSPNRAFGYMIQAWYESEKSRCIKKQVGAVIVDDQTGRIIATAYNGMGQTRRCSLEIHESNNGCWHAEQIAISRATMEGEDLSGKTIYITDSPCRLCARIIILAGIRKVVYERNHGDPLGRELLKVYGVILIQFKACMPVPQSLQLSLFYQIAGLVLFSRILANEGGIASVFCCILQCPTSLKELGDETMSVLQKRMKAKETM